MPAILQALNTLVNQLIMRCDIAFKILLAVSAKSHHIEVSQCSDLGTDKSDVRIKP